MTRPVFADRFYYLALVNPRDTAHARAADFARRSSFPVVTIAWVIQEMADGLAAPPTRLAFLRLLASLQADSQTTIVDVDVGLWSRGLDLYRARPDKAWSLTDCTSFVVMQDRGLTEALTGDRHFEQAGFTMLLT